jgi:phosphotransferase system enzyme I (PtsI)
MRTLSGISAAPGIAIGRAFLYQEDLDIPRYTILPKQTPVEMNRFLAAAEEAVKELQSLGKAARDKDQKAIFAAHRLMVEDPDFHYKIKAQLESKYENIEWIIFETVQELARKLLESPDNYLRERAADLTDVSRRIIKILLGLKRFSLADLEEDVILAARNLLPSEVLAMNRERVKALILDAGSRTSHTAIILRSFGIPGVLGLSSAVREITNGSLIIVDGSAGQIILEPNAETLAHYQALLESKERSSEIFSILRELSAETTDGRLVSLMANIGIPKEAGELARYGAEGVGLFRSEFLFLQNGRNSEEAQLEAYSRVIKTMKGKPVTIRTVDLGGDKIMPVMQTADEENPLLGWRAIRFSLALPEMFKTQLRAILRAGIYGKARIMFPMISGIEELEQALTLLEEARNECRKKGLRFADNIETGTMIEIPSAAITAGILAEKSDFFSIGTNDLMQYTLAVDRGNEKVTYLARSAHPAVLKLIKQTIDAAHAKGIPAAMCGELARDPEATALLLGMGLDEFSMAATSVLQVKHIIRNVNYESCKNLADAVLASTSCQQVKTLIRDWHREHIPGLVFDSDMIPDNK